MDECVHPWACTVSPSHTHNCSCWGIPSFRPYPVPVTSVSASISEVTDFRLQEDDDLQYLLSSETAGLRQGSSLNEGLRRGLAVCMVTAVLHDARCIGQV